MDLVFVSLLVVHIGAAATWAGGAITLELVFEPRLDTISRIQATLVSRKVEQRFTIISWVCLIVISSTGVTLSLLQGTFNFGSLLQPTGLFLLGSIIITIAAVASGLVITYYAPLLQSTKAAETNLRGHVRSLVRLNNALGVAAIVLMVVFTELHRAQV